MMNNQMRKIGYNVNKMPLGKLSKDSIMKGYKVLKEIEQELDKSTVNHLVVTELSS